MKKHFLLSFFIAMLLISCSNDNGRKSENSDFLGSWKMTEILVRQANGSTVSQPVTENKTLTFKKSGSVVTNYSLCIVNAPVQDSYSEPYYADEDRISVTDCTNGGFPVYYEMDGSKLRLNYPGSEIYAYKFVKISPN